jgi:hypothetical protein
MRYKQILAVLALLTVLAACGHTGGTNLEAMAMENGDSGHLTKWNDIVYVFWSMADQDLAGEPFAVATDSAGTTRKVYEVKGQRREDWILQFFSGGCLLYKAEGVADIPAEFLALAAS